jgi:hypothetical protein
MNWDDCTARFNGMAPSITGPTYGHLMYGDISKDTRSAIFDAARSCARTHLKDLGKPGERAIQVSVPPGQNELHLVYICPLETSGLSLPIVQFSAPLNMIAEKPDGARDAFLCIEVEKLITLGERVIAQKFTV